MTSTDLLGLLFSYLYAGGLLAVGEGLQRFVGIPATLTRKIIHVGAGMWIFGILTLFDRWEIGIIPFATFIGLNYLFYRLRFFKAMDRESRSPGTVYFAIAVTVLFGLLWRPQGPVDLVAIAVAAIMAMTWGDALAALIGEFYGRRRYRVGSSQRSFEGSFTMLGVSAITIGTSLAWVPGSALAPLAPLLSATQIAVAAVLGAVVATLSEAVAPHGTDNLTVPFSVALVLWLIV
jgi:phytol kinase